MVNEEKESKVTNLEKAQLNLNSWLSILEGCPDTGILIGRGWFAKSQVEKSAAAAEKRVKREKELAAT